MKVTLSLSFGIFDTWETQDPKLVIKKLLKQEPPPSPAMEHGIDKHKEWEKWIKQHRTIPDELGGGALVSPVAEFFAERIFEVNEYLRVILRGKVDCKDGLKVYDWKTGRKPAADYAKYSSQHEFYKLLFPTLANFEYRCFNEKENDLTIETISIESDAVYDKAHERLVEESRGIASYLQREKVLKDVLEIQKRGTDITLERNRIYE